MRAIHAIISGRVQGVCFRYYTRETARELGIRGWVKNRRDGQVELLAAGAPDAMDRFESWLSHGPPMAHVTSVKKNPTETLPSQATFEIQGTEFSPF